MHMARITAPPSSVQAFPDGSMRSPECDPQKALRRALARAGLVERYEHICRRCKSRGTPYAETHEDADVRRCPTCSAKLWPKAIPRPMRFHDLRHTAATLMLRAGVDAHRVQRILRHASVTTTTGTYGHLALEDLRDAVNRIGPASFADTLLTEPTRALPAPKVRAESLGPIERPEGEPPGSRTQDPRLKRTDPLVAPGGRASQALATTGQVASDDSTRHQVLAGFPLSFAAPLLTVREVAQFLRVSPRTVYAMCAEGRLAHVRVMNAIRVEAAALGALLRAK
jgi:excisionase family DNA binding protein